MNKGDKIFLIWGIGFIVVFISLMLSNESSLEYIQTYGVSTVVGELMAVVVFIVLVPYGIYRLMRKKK